MNICIDCRKQLVDGVCVDSTTDDIYCGNRGEWSVTNLKLAENAARRRMHTFIGGKHHCGNRLRYTVGQNCVSCRLKADEVKRRARGVKKRSNTNAQLAEIAEGNKFNGTECVSCGETLRYVNKPYRCVNCSNLRNRGVK